MLLSLTIISKHQKNILRNQMEVSQEMIKMQIENKYSQPSKNDNN